MTKKQIRQFNHMRSVLRRIAKDYQTPEQIRRSSERELGLEADEAIQMAYENIQGEARAAVKGVREIPLENA